MKVSFIGAGRVGTCAAYSALHAIDQINEMALVDIAPNLAEGEAEDLTHAAYAMEREVKITGATDYAKTKNSDVFVIAAGIARKPGQTREELLKINNRIVTDVAKNIPKKTIVITVTNPVDALNYSVWKTTGLPRGKVMGMGGVLDTARLHSLGYDGFIVGAHGEDMVATEKIPKDAMERLVGTGNSVISKKGATFYGPGVAINRMLYAIANNTKETLPCSCILDGEYGLKNVSIGVPAKIGANGAEEIVEIPLPDGFKSAAESIKRQIESLGL